MFTSFEEFITGEDDGVQAGFAPQLHEVDHVPEAQGGVAGEDHAWLAEVTAEVTVNAGVVLQLVALDQLKQQRRTHTLALAHLH